MDKTKKKNVKRIIALVAIVLVVALLAAMPLFAKQEPEEDGPKASILSGTAQLGSINKELIGGGTLAEEEAVTITIPTAVKLTGFAVNNNDVVTKGDVLATVDRVSVMQAITQVQETLEYLSEQIEKTSATGGEETVTALAGGTVKMLYAKAGDSAQTVMLEHGALAVLSLDGLMAVEFETDSDVAAGTEVQVTFTDGTAVQGEVETSLAGTMVVTLKDQNYAVGQTVWITTESGANIGSGELYIYSPWNATAYTGTVKSVKAAEGDTLAAGKALLVLEDVGYSALHGQLLGQRREYEDMMLQLFEMYQTETLTAPCDGVVTGIDKDSAQLLASQGGYTLTLLTNAPNGDDSVLYENYVGKVSAVAKNGWAVQMDPQPIPVADYLDLENVSIEEDKMTETVLYTETEAPVYAMVDGAWAKLEFNSIKEGDILLFAMDDKGEPVWKVLIQKASQQPDTPGGNTPGGNTGNFPTGGGNWGGSGNTQQDTQFEIYTLDTVQVASVTPQTQMTLDITVDEQDMRHLSVGMTAQVKINALGGEKFTATISQLGNTGTNNGGSSKFTVTLTMERAGNMLSGMNATATIVLSATEQVLTVPADALVEQGTKTVIYTRYDEAKETLLDPVEVQVGSSDGETVEILGGLKDGQTYYYPYYDTLEISATPEFGNMGGMSGMGGMGGMGGMMPR